MATNGPKGPQDPPDISSALAKNIPTWRAAYSDRTCALMAAFCQLAYIAFDPTVTDPEAKEANRQELERRLAAGGFTLLDVFNHKFTQAFLAINNEEFAVLSFRGTANLPDWLIDLNIKPVPLPERPDVLVHEGFLDAFDGCREAVAKAVDRKVPKDLGLYITGHSLGGGLAQLASAVLDADNIAACYTFGSPRVGTGNFDRQVKCPHYRLINHWDIVPSVPPPWFAGFRHTGDPRLLTPSKSATEALRRDRNEVLAFFNDIRALARFVVSRKLEIISDHMIWNYRTQLEGIAAYRAGPPPAAASGVKLSPLAAPVADSP